MEHSNDESLILLLHDGELRDVRSLLDELGVRVRERIGPLRPAEVKAAWKIVFATPKRLLDFKALQSGPRPTLIGIADGCSNTLRTQMQRLRVDYVVDRPVHPIAMRLLVLHALYNGPERRKLDRISIGAPARLKIGLFSKPVTLAEISHRGARVISLNRLSVGGRLKLVIGRELTKSGSLRLPAQVVRIDDSGEEGLEAGLRFDDMNARTALALKHVIDLHRRGPVQIRHHVADTTPIPTPRTSYTQTLSPTASSSGSAATRSRPLASKAPAGAAAACVPTPTEAERRRDDRHPYGSRIVALGQEAARVLIGRDISTGGMRVDSHPELGLGARLKVALHAGPRSEPVLVDALVDRDDGDEGVFLRFRNLDDRLLRELDMVIGRLSFSTGDPADGDVVISELISLEESPAAN